MLSAKCVIKCLIVFLLTSYFIFLLPSGHTSLPAGNAPADMLLDHMKHDKKTRNGVMHFVLARAIGDAFVHGDVPEAVVTKLLKRGFDAV